MPGNCLSVLAEEISKWLTGCKQWGAGGASSIISRAAFTFIHSLLLFNWRTMWSEMQKVINKMFQEGRGLTQAVAAKCDANGLRDFCYGWCSERISWKPGPCHRAREVWQRGSCSQPSRRRQCRQASNGTELQGAQGVVSPSRAMRIRYIINGDGTITSAGSFLMF